MAKTNGGPPCPKVSRLEELMDWLTEKKHDVISDEPGSVDKEVYQECVEALDWLHTMLSNRQTYHRQRNLIQRAKTKIAEEMLSKDELAEIDRQVRKDLGVE